MYGVATRAPVRGVARASVTGPPRPWRPARFGAARRTLAAARTGGRHRRDRARAPPRFPWSRILRLELHAPGLQIELLRSPDPVEDHAQVPVAHRVSEEEEMAVGHPLAHRERELLADVSVDEVVDVAVLRDDVAVPLRIRAIDRPVQLQKHRPFRQRQPRVRVRALDRNDLALRRPVQEPTLQRPTLRLVPNDVQRFTRLGQHPLDQVVVVRRDDEQLRPTACAQQRRQAGEHAVQRLGG